MLFGARVLHSHGDEGGEAGGVGRRKREREFTSYGPRRGHTYRAGLRGEARGGQEGRARGKLRLGPLSGFLREGWGAGGAAALGVSFRGLKAGGGVVSSRRVSGLGKARPGNPEPWVSTWARWGGVAPGW